MAQGLCREGTLVSRARGGVEKHVLDYWSVCLLINLTVLFETMLAQLDAAKDPENALHTFHEPFTSLGSSQFGIVPNQTISVAEPKTPSASAPQGDWGTASISGSPNSSE